MIDSPDFIYSFFASTFIGSILLFVYLFSTSHGINSQNEVLLDNIIAQCNLKVNECNIALKYAKYSERQKFATLVQMRMNAYNSALKTRKECIEKLANKMSLSLEDIIETRKTIKRMDTKLDKYNRKMAPYPVFQSMFAVPQKNDYNPTAKQSIATNGETRERLHGNIKQTQSGDTDTESGISSISVDNSPARS